MKILVTGGAGFIGSHFIRYLLQQAEVEQVLCIDALTYAGHLENLSDCLQDSRFQFQKLDLRDKEEVLACVRGAQPTHIVHLAAESHVDRSIEGPGDFIHTNVVGTFNLLEACRGVWQENWNGKRFHHVSTDEVYGSLGETGLFTESSPYAPNSPYSASKASSDLLVRAYHHTYGMPVVITNCSNNYGPYQFPEKLIPVVIQKIMQRKSIPVYGDGMNVRDWLFVRDHCEALWIVLTRGKSGETYNIGGNNEWANLRLVELICDLADELNPPSDKRSRELISFVKDRPGHDRRYAIDSSKIEGELGWKAGTRFEDGMRETVLWYLENRKWVETVLGKK
ncbi:MAG: dTDP-glucose 4,6-dehydratase [Verrucomicrobiota bacterium]|nr:dTDP-glucose 4,6-dehydratase [Verrucomicrobiota bacterium]